MASTPLEPSTADDSRPALTVRDELRALTNQRLVAAAQLVFERDGYARATVGNIAAEANVNRATFYLHFADKAQVMLAVMRANLADTPAYWREVDAALIDGGREALRAALGGTLDWYQRHRRTLRPVREALATDLNLAEQTENNFAAHADHMARYLARVPAAERERAHLRLRLLLIQLDQLAFRLVVQRRHDIDRDDMLDEITDIWRLTLPAIDLA